MTKQEAFNKVFDWLTRDGAEQCSNDYDSCLYIREDGNRCAIGVLLSEETLSIVGESKLGIKGLLGLPKADGGDLVREDLGEELTTGYPSFLVHLQDLHDNSGNWHSPARMREALTQSAWDNSLTCPDGTSHAN